MGNILTPDELREVIQELTEEQLGIVWGGAMTKKTITTQKEHLQPIKMERDDEEYEGKYSRGR